MESGPDLVKCTSGYTYAQRPVSFTYEGMDHRVREVAAEWQEPDAKKFIVLTHTDHKFELSFEIEHQLWQIQPLGTDLTTSS